MREPSPPPDVGPTVSRRRVLLLGATASLATACGGSVEGGPPDAVAGDTTPPEAGADSTVGAVMDVAHERLDVPADIPPDGLDAAADASPDAAPDAVIDRAEVAPDRADVPAPPRDAGPDTVDAPADMGLPCGLSDRYLASLLVTAVPTRGGVVDAALRVVVARDVGGLYAMSAVCPHNGCVVEVASGAATSCPCHGSTFDNNGVRTRGPATRSLLHHPLSVCSGRVYVDPSRSTSVATRTPAA